MTGILKVQVSRKSKCQPDILNVILSEAKDLKRGEYS